MNDDPLDIWRKKLDHLQRAEAIASDASEKFKLQREIEEAKSKISKLESEEHRSGSLAKGSQKKSSFRQFVDSLLYLKDFLPVIGILAALIAYVRPGFRLEVTSALLFCIVWAVYVAYRAYQSFGTTRPSPGPRGLWQIIFNRLPPQKGKRLKHGVVKILVIFDDSTQSIVDSICQEYRNGPLDIGKFKYTSDFKRRDLIASLDAADAIYIFCTEMIKAKDELYETVNDWAVEHSHKPVLAVDFLPPQEPYHWTFSHIPKAAAVSGLWQLLARATERARQLRIQADTFRRVWGYSVLIAALLLVGLIWWSHRTSVKATEAEDKLIAIEGLYKTERNDLYALESFCNSLYPVRNTIQDLLESQKEKKDKAGVIALDALKRFVVHMSLDLRRRQGVSNDTGSLSLWRKYKDEADGTEYFAEVVRSDDNRQRCYKGGFDSVKGEYPPLVTCAVERGSFVHWRDDLKNGEDASWSKHGDVNGHWRILSDGTQRYLEVEGGSKCSYARSDHERTGLSCLGVESGDQVLKSGVCLSTNLARGFPQEQWTKHYLYEAVSIMQLLPDDLVITNNLRSICKKK